MGLTLNSLSFMQGREIPVRHTCDGEGISPRLMWDGVPSGTKSLALIVDDPDAPDPDAPEEPVVHWILYNIPSSATCLVEGAEVNDLPVGVKPGRNDWQSAGYEGLCPEKGEHRYFFKLYALDTMLPDLKKPTKEILEKAMQPHILAKCSLLGLYKRKKR